MTRNELLFDLRSLEIQLLSPEVDAVIATQDAAAKKRFVALSVDLRLVIMKLTTAHISTIADRLDDLSDELEVGIKSLKKEIASLDNAIKIINTLSEVVGYAARIVALVL